MWNVFFNLKELLFARYMIYTIFGLNTRRYFPTQKIDYVMEKQLVLWGREWKRNY